jgi:cobalt-zinc-cadmium efflux system membrane fusion protein
MKSYIFNTIALIIILSATSCGNRDGENETQTDLKMEGDVVTVREGSPVSSKIKTEIISLRDYTTSCTTTGTVRPLSGNLAEVSAPFDGKIVKSFVKLGQRVSAGSPLFEVSSSDYFEAVRSFSQAQQIKSLSEKNYLRKKDLKENGACSEKEFEEAESDFKNASKELERAKATLAIFNIKEENLSAGKPMTICSPVNGEIVRNNITVGQYRKADGEAAVIVAGLDKVWVVARVKEKNIGQINREERVSVFTESQPDRPVEGFVDYIGNIMDEETRSVEVYVVCNNADRCLKPGMFVTVVFEHKLSNVLVVPADAILQQEDKSYLYVTSGKNSYIKRAIGVYPGGNEKEVIVRSGLAAGDEIVTEGGIYLR